MMVLRKQNKQLSQILVQCARALLEAKASPNKANNDGATALMLACAANHDQCARALLEAKADPNTETE